MIRFNDIVQTLIEYQQYTKSLEAKIKRLEKERDDWREMAQPGFKRHELEAELDGEIRLLREQG